MLIDPRTASAPDRRSSTVRKTRLLSVTIDDVMSWGPCWIEDIGPDDRAGGWCPDCLCRVDDKKAHKCEAVRVFEVDDGATYWIAARSLREACACYWQGLDVSGGGEQGHLAIAEMTDKHAAKVMIRQDDGELKSALACARTAGLGLIGCSEW